MGLLNNATQYAHARTQLHRLESSSEVETLRDVIDVLREQLGDYECYGCRPQLPRIPPAGEEATIEQLPIEMVRRVAKSLALLEPLSRSKASRFTPTQWLSFTGELLARHAGTLTRTLDHKTLLRLAVAHL